MTIHKDKCLEIGLPAPKRHHTHVSYVLNCIATNYNLNTRICRYIGIHNLHSIVSTINSKKIEFTLAHEPVLCPFTGKIPYNPVDVIYMTNEQQEQYQSTKKPDSVN